MSSERRSAARTESRLLPTPPHSPPRVVITVDVEWACPEVIQDIVRLLDERNLYATFFCTHPDIPLGNHEKALHPNYRRGGNSHLAHSENGVARDRSDAELYRHVLQTVHGMYPEAVGVRSHCLFFESNLLDAYKELGLQYDSNCFLPMAGHLTPTAITSDILEFPIYYMDEWDLRNQATQFRLEGLRLRTDGLKILDFHPNLVFLNAATHDQYVASKKHYHDPQWLCEHRRPERGARSLFLDVLNDLATHADDVTTLSELNSLCRRE